MKRTLCHIEFGACYGSFSLAVIACLCSLYLAIYSYFFEWPKGETVTGVWMGLLSLSVGFFMVGSFFGYLGGAVFGLLASMARNPFGWTLSGALGGAISSLCLFWLMGSLTHNPIVVTLSLVFFFSVPILVFATIGFVVGRAIKRGNSNLLGWNMIQDW